MKMLSLDVLVRNILPQVLPCPRSMVLDALQATAMDFCKLTRLWKRHLTEPIYAGEQSIDLTHMQDIDIVDVVNVSMKGTKLDREDYSFTNDSIVFKVKIQGNTVVNFDLILRPSRYSEKLPAFLIEEYGDILVQGALMRLKLMRGSKIEWSDPEGAILSSQLYEAGVVRARIHDYNASRNGAGIFSDTFI